MEKRNNTVKERGNGERAGKEGGEKTKSSWNGDQTTALIYLYIRHVGGRGRVHFDYRMTYHGPGSLLRQSNATDSSDRTASASDHEDVVVQPQRIACMEISTLFRLQFHVASSVGIIIFLDAESYLFDVNRLVLHGRTELKRHRARPGREFRKSLLSRYYYHASSWKPFERK